MRNDPRHGMFLLQGDTLVGLDETPYDSEDLLQRHLADHPDLLAGHQIDPVTPRRWLLVDRELAIPDAPEASGRWSLDHLFLDQDGVPTLVEVKRSSDTRIRREVVGQMLEYAANAIVHVPADRIRATFEGRCARDGREPGDRLAEAFGAGVEPDAYWAQVEENVRAHRLRLIFLADVIPPELARMVEYLNEQMRTTEVLAVELKQYTGGDLKTLVPRVIGRTAAAEATKGGTGGSKVARTWTLDEFLAEVTNPAARVLVDASLDWLRRHGVEPFIGRGRYGPLHLRVRDNQGSLHKVANVNTQGWTMFAYDTLKNALPFDDKTKRIEVNYRLNRIPGVEIPDELAAAASWPGLPFEALATPAGLDEFFGTLDWIAEQMAAVDGQAR